MLLNSTHTRLPRLPSEMFSNPSTPLSTRTKRCPGNDFSETVKTKLAHRAGGLCSMCGCRTYGPHSTNNTKEFTIGEAAHITSAGENGPRCDPSMTSGEISDISNGMWLCSNCHIKIDRDIEAYSKEYLKHLKGRAEKRAKLNFKSSSAETNLHTVVSNLVINDIEQCQTKIESAKSAEGLTDLDYVNFEDPYYNPSVPNAMVQLIKFIADKAEDASIDCSHSIYKKMLNHLKSIAKHCNIHDCGIVHNLVFKCIANLAFPDSEEAASELGKNSANQPFEEEEEEEEKEEEKEEEEDYHSPPHDEEEDEISDLMSDLGLNN